MPQVLPSGSPPVDIPSDCGSEFLSHRMLHNPALLKPRLHNAPDRKSGSQPHPVCHLFRHGLLPVSKAGMFAHRNDNHLYKVTYPLPMHRLTWPLENHALLQSSVFPQEYLPLHSQMQIKSVHGNPFSSLYPCPCVVLLPVGILPSPYPRSVEFLRGILRYTWIHIPDTSSPSAAHIHSNGRPFFHLCVPTRIHYSAGISLHGHILCRK